VTRTFIIGLPCLILSTAVSLYAQRGAPQAPRRITHSRLDTSMRQKSLRLTIVSRESEQLFLRCRECARTKQQCAGSRPVKLFDNVYAVGNSETTVYALTSSEGIVLLDAGFENKAESCLFRSCKNWGSIPPGSNTSCWDTVTRIISAVRNISRKVRNEDRSHGRRLGLINAPARGGGAIPPKMCACRGATVQVRRSHHHADRNSGAHARFARFHFPVKDKGQTRTAGLFGGTSDDRHSDDGCFKQYTQSIAHYLEQRRR
jgi:hypothetical protein